MEGSSLLTMVFGMLRSRAGPDRGRDSRVSSAAEAQVVGFRILPVEVDFESATLKSPASSHYPVRHTSRVNSWLPGWAPLR